MRGAEASLRLSASRVRRACAVASIGAAALAGCGLGAGPATSGDVSLRVTRDYGAVPLSSFTETDPSAAETVIRLLDRSNEIETRYGGGFVQAVDGLSGTVSGGRSLDWFFYVNGVESPQGAAEVRVRGGDRIWWDYRDWTAAMRVPAVVGSWPEPFAQVSADAAERLPVSVQCGARRPSCVTVRESLAAEGVKAAIERLGDESRAEALRLLVAPWRRLAARPQLRAMADGPAASGVFARFEDRGRRLVALRPDGTPGATLGRGAALVAALRDGDAPPIWLITGTDEAGVRRAAGTLEDASLHDRFALAGSGRRLMPLPLRGEGASASSPAGDAR